MSNGASTLREKTPKLHGTLVTTDKYKLCLLISSSLMRGIYGDKQHYTVRSWRCAKPVCSLRLLCNIQGSFSATVKNCFQRNFHLLETDHHVNHRSNNEFEKNDAV